ncbi:Daple [Symbioplanes lichenis]|uniref:Daple n=1 Tax=Symbioplanes lichenis TaxID=1629072 RepID=UPI002739E2A5|nr:Daple [Actinoplanes lichenis]
MNGWAPRESPWSAGSALDAEKAENDLPSWRRPATEIRPYTRERSLTTDSSPSDLRAYAVPPPPHNFQPSPQSERAAGGPYQPGPQNERQSQPHERPGAAPVSPVPLTGPMPGSPAARPSSPAPVGAEGGTRAERADRAGGGTPRWQESRVRYDDLLSPLPPADEPGRPDPLSPELLRGEEPRAAASASAPPYPYEGDLDDSRRDTRMAFPAERPSRSAPRPWGSPDAARHAQPTPMEGLPQVAPADDARSGDQGPGRPSYDPSSFPRRLPYEPAFPARPGDPGAGSTGEQTPALPQRVPARPDVPTVPEPPSVEPSAETPALARIATHLRRDDALESHERQEGFDVKAILEAVREVPGVRDAALRTTPAGANSLRLDLAEGADPAEVSRQVARLLQDRMGLDAAMQGAAPLGGMPPAPAPRSAPPGPAPRSGPPSPAPRSAPPSPAPRSAPPAAAAPRSAPPASTGAPATPASRSVSPAPLRPGPAPASAPPSVTRPGANPASFPTAGTYQSGAGYAPFVPAQPNPAGRTLPQRNPAGESPRPLLEPGDRPGPRIMIENVQVNTFGTEATVSVRLTVGGRIAAGEATGPAFDGYLLRLCATATAHAVDQLLGHSMHVEGPAKCYVEHAAVVPFGSIQVAVAVVLLATDGWVEQLAGSAVVTGDDRDAMVRATLAAVNRRLEALLS